jgi:multicomponent Na+:H+ antiporter subunit C
MPLSVNIYEVVAVILFAVGFLMLLLDRNLLKKVIGLDIMDSALFLFLTSFGYVEDRIAPIAGNGSTDFSHYVNPIPGGLVLTGIVISVSVSAVMLALVVRVFRRYKSLDLDKIHLYTEEEE